MTESTARFTGWRIRDIRAALLAATVAWAFTAPAYAERPANEAFLRAADCRDCTVWTAATLHLPETGVEAYSAKVAHPLSGEGVVVTLLGDGSTASEEELLNRERATHRARYGGLTRELAERLSRMSPRDLLPVWIWTSVDIAYPAKESFEDDPSAAEAHDREVRASLERASAPILQWLRSREYVILEDGATSPLVRAELPAHAVAELPRLENVALVGEDTWPGQPHSTAWHDTVRAGFAHSLSDGDVPACVLEGEQPSNYAWLPVVEIASPMGPSATHMWGTLGVIRNTFGPTMNTSRQMYAANWGGFVGSAATPSAEQWCMDRGAVAINFSWSFSNGAPGGPNGSDNQKDFLTKRFPYPLFVKSSGNAGGQTGFEVVANRSFNSLIVGASDDRGTWNLGDDTIAGFSSWMNPTTPHSDFELPNVVAPGVNVDAASLTGLNGTSFAAPVTTGAVMLAARADMNTFRWWPEMQRAVVLATAVRDVDGGRLTRLPAADHRDGAGLVHAYNATALGSPFNYRAPGSPAEYFGRHRKTLVFSSDFDAAGNGNDVYRLRAGATGRMRVAIAWDSTATCNAAGCGTNALDADLDLIVRDAGGAIVCSSVTFDSSWEICDFPVVAGQQFTSRLKRWATSSSSTYFGIAWFNWIPGTE